MLEIFYFTLLRSFPTFAHKIPEFFHVAPQICAAALPQTERPELYQAIVCGIHLPMGQAKRLFLDSGLIYIMVVSGIHLTVIEEVLNSLLPWGVMPLLGVYSLMTGFQPPVVRALIRKWISQPARDRFGLTGLQIELAISVLVFIFYPSWLWSRSFLMGWMCGIAISLPKWFRRADVTIKCYLFLLPFCWLSPIVIGWNLLLIPAIALVLFPLSLTTLLLPPVHLLTDPGWKLLLWILRSGPSSSPLPLFISTPYLLVLTATIHILFIYGETEWRRASAFSLCAS